MSYAPKTLLNKQLPSYVGFLVLFFALCVTILLSGNTVSFITKATVGSEPKNIQISNISDSSFTISFTTDTSVVGTISYGLDPSTPNIALDDRDQEASGSADHQVHFITVKNLNPSTKYYYVIDSGSQKAENNGSPFEVTTAAPLLNTPADQPTLSGTVSLNDGSIPTEGIIYVSTDGSAQLATFINTDGTYQIPLNQLRNSTQSDTAALTPDTVLQVQAVTSSEQSTAKVLVSAASKVPKIVLSQNYDFTLGPTQQSSQSAQISPGQAFPVLATPAPVSSPEISSPTEAQAFKDQQPLFEGRALPNTEVDITIRSTQEILVKLNSDNSGSWQYRPATALAPGKHTITIQSINAAGILQTMSRSFTVYASGSKFVEPSISPSPSPKVSPTAVPTPTISPTETPAPTPTAKPTINTTPAPTHGPVPNTGSSAIMNGFFAAATAVGIGALLIFLSIV
ncbi:MAG TPA: Ig-like domain-containing protein [Candidatus Acidoferrales bacterium]|nr:Ig-like domain-containing protein [Candidatus Acidoferrales bacterium]